MTQHILGSYYCWYLVKIPLLMLCSSTAIPSHVPHRSAEVQRALRKSRGQDQDNVQGLHGASVPPWASGSHGPTLAKTPKNDTTGPNDISLVCKMHLSLMCCLSSSYDGNSRASASKQPKKLWRQQTLRKPCPKDSRHHIFPTALWFANETN